MMYRPKRQSAAMLALVFFVLSVFPVKRSEAFLPPLIYAAYMTSTVSGATYTLAGLAGAIGIAGMYLTVTDAMDNAVRVPLGTTTAANPPAPAAPSSAAPVASSDSQVCSASIGLQSPGGNVDGCNLTNTYTLNTAYPYDAYSVQCSGTRTQTHSASQPGCAAYDATVNYNWIAQKSGAVNCPAGYQSQAGSCILVNARQVADDKICDMLVSNGQFATADDMNCGASADGSKVAPMLRDGKVIAYGTNSSGQPLMWEVTPGAQTFTVKEMTQIQTATQTQVKTTTATVDAATATVTAVSTQTAPGSIASPSASASPTTLPQGETVSPVNTPTVTQDSTKPIDLQWPSDYARTGEAKTAADSITDLLKPATEVNDPTVPDWADHWGATFNPLKAWSMPGHSSQCPVAGFGWNGVTYTIDSHCQLITDHWSALQTASVVVWVISALWILLGA